MNAERVDVDTESVEVRMSEETIRAIDDLCRETDYWSHSEVVADAIHEFATSEQ